MAIFTAYL